MIVASSAKIILCWMVWQEHLTSWILNVKNRSVLWNPHAGNKENHEKCRNTKPDGCTRNLTSAEQSSWVFRFRRICWFSYGSTDPCFPRQATLYLPKDPSHNSACASFSAIRDASQSKNLRLLLSRKLPTRLSALARNIYFTIFPEHLSLKKNPSEQDTVSCQKKPVQNIFFVFCN